MYSPQTIESMLAKLEIIYFTAMDVLNICKEQDVSCKHELGFLRIVREGMNEEINQILGNH